MSVFNSHQLLEQVCKGRLAILRPLFDSMESPAQFILAVFLATLAVIAGKRVRFVGISPFTFTPSVFFVLVGPAGRGRKGSAQSLLELFLKPHGLLQGSIGGRAVRVVRNIDSGEGLIEAFPPTGEILILVEEISSVFKKGGREGSVIIENLNTIFDGKALERNVAKKVMTGGTRRVEKPYAVMVGGTTPENIELFFSSVLLTSGFSSRILFVPGCRENLFPIPRKERIRKVLSRIQDTLGEFDRLCATEPRIGFSRRAAEAWQEYYGEIDRYLQSNDGVPERLKERFDVYCLKVATLLALLEGKICIEVKELDRAATFLAFVGLSYEELFRQADLNESRKVEEKILGVLRGNGQGLSRRELQQKVRGKHVDAEKFNRVLRSLLENEVIRSENGLFTLFERSTAQH